MRRIPHAAGLALAVAMLATVAGSIPAVFAGPADAATASKCPTFNVGQAVKESPTVFHGRITGAGKTAKDKTVVYPATVMKQLKGAVFGNIKITLDPGPCQPTKPLVADEDYYFFAVPKGGTYVVAGKAPRVEPYSDKLQQQIAQVFPTEAPPPTTPVVHFGKQLLDPVKPLTVLLMPGIGLFVVGLLGLLVFTLLGRRRTA